MNSSDISSDFGFCVHVELAIPHVRRISRSATSAQSTSEELSYLKFIFLEKTHDPRLLDAEFAPAANILGPVPWTYPPHASTLRLFLVFKLGAHYAGYYI